MLSFRNDLSHQPEVINADSVGFQFERKVPCHTTNTKEMPSHLDGNQILLIIGRIPRTRIPRSAIRFPAIRILRCLRPNVGEILHPDHGRPIRGRMNHDTMFPSTIHDEIELR
jgi:hypothetical protein